MRNDFLKTVQGFISIQAIGPSSLRNQGKGVLKNAQDFCAKLNLQNYSNLNEVQFKRQLDQDTLKLIKALKLKNKPWGTARKALNLFLRESLYNKYLSKKYSLDRIEKFLEIPLDQVVSHALIKLKTKGKLPKWHSLKSLDEETSEKFQEFAQELAQNKYHIARVHLDIYLWTNNR